MNPSNEFDGWDVKPAKAGWVNALERVWCASPMIHHRGVIIGPFESAAQRHSRSRDATAMPSNEFDGMALARETC
jgi:hypothetical protein